MFVSLQTLVADIPSDVCVALAPDYSGCAVSAVHALGRRHITGLHLIGIPQLGYQADFLIGCGCVASVEAAAVTLGEFGPAPRFSAAVSSGEICMRDSTCPAIHAGLQAAEKGIPFMPLRGVLGSDLVTHRSDWKVIDNPFAEQDPILLVPRIRPDYALFHAPRADRDGNVWVGLRRELMTAAHAARHTLVTVEQIGEQNLLADERLAAGTIPALYITRIAAVPGGARPVGLAGHYEADSAVLQRYARMARSTVGFGDYLRGLADG